jgi:hypothetical protein
MTVTGAIASAAGRSDPRVARPATDPQQAEARFLHLCLRSLWEPSSLPTAIALAGEQQLDWAALHLIVEREHLSPLLYHILRGRQAIRIRHVAHEDQLIVRPPIA